MGYRGSEKRFSLNSWDSESSDDNVVSHGRRRKPCFSSKFWGFGLYWAWLFTAGGARRTAKSLTFPMYWVHLPVGARSKGDSTLGHGDSYAERLTRGRGDAQAGLCGQKAYSIAPAMSGKVHRDGAATAEQPFG